MLLRIKSLPAQEKCFMRILPCVLGAVFWFYSLLLRSEGESLYAFIPAVGCSSLRVGERAGLAVSSCGWFPPGWDFSQLVRLELTAT